MPMNEAAGEGIVRGEYVVLVVDDEPLLREGMAAALKAHGFGVVTAGTSAEARTMFEAHHPDALVLDLDLSPGPTSLETAEALLARKSDLALILLTHAPDQLAGGVQDPAGLGVVSLDKRRFGMEDLIEVLEAALRSNGPPRGASDRPALLAESPTQGWGAFRQRSRGR